MGKGGVYGLLGPEKAFGKRMSPGGALPYQGLGLGMRGI